MKIDELKSKISNLEHCRKVLHKLETCVKSIEIHTHIGKGIDDICICLSDLNELKPILIYYYKTKINKIENELKELGIEV